MKASHLRKSGWLFYLALNECALRAGCVGFSPQ